MGQSARAPLVALLRETREGGHGRSGMQPQQDHAPGTIKASKGRAAFNTNDFYNLRQFKLGHRIMNTAYKAMSAQFPLHFQYHKISSLILVSVAKTHEVT